MIKTPKAGEDRRETSMLHGVMSSLGRLLAPLQDLAISTFPNSVLTSTPGASFT